MIANLSRFLFVFIACVFGAVVPAIAFSPATFQPTPIAIVDFTGVDGDESPIGWNIVRIVATDLECSKRFRPLDRKSFVQTGGSLQTGPRFVDWRRIDVPLLAYGRVEVKVDNRLRVEFRLWDVFGERQVIGKAYTSLLDNGNGIAQAIADDAVFWVSGKHLRYQRVEEHNAKVAKTSQSGTATST